jgi:RNA polymerase sigma-70 factor, ECF subfamily
MDDLTDELLLEAYAGGREEAFEVLVERHGSAIKAFAYRMLRNAEQAEDVYVATFGQAAARAPTWQPRGTVRGFLYTVADRLCLDTIRQRNRDRSAVEAIGDGESRETFRASPEAEAMMGEMASELELAIQGLSAEHRKVLLLRTVHGLSTAETAAIVGLDEGQVRSQLSWARKRLRKRLGVPRRDVAGSRTGRRR